MTIISHLILPALMGVVSASLSTWLYWRFSPQEKLSELSGQVAEARVALKRFEGNDLRVVMSLTWQALAPSFRQLGLMLGPAMLAILPILVVAWPIESTWTSISFNSSVNFFWRM